MKKRMIGQVCWWWGGNIVGNAGVYEGEDPNSSEVYQRARHTAEMIPDRPYNGPLEQLAYLHYAQRSDQRKFYAFPEPRVAA